MSGFPMIAANVLFSMSGLWSSTDFRLKFSKSGFSKSGFSISGDSGFELRITVAASPFASGTHVPGSDSLTCTLIAGGCIDDDVTNTVLTAPDRRGTVTHASSTGGAAAAESGGSGTPTNDARPPLPAGGASTGWFAMCTLYVLVCDVVLRTQTTYA